MDDPAQFGILDDCLCPHGRRRNWLSDADVEQLLDQPAREISLQLQQRLD